MSYRGRSANLLLDHDAGGDLDETRQARSQGGEQGHGLARGRRIDAHPPARARALLTRRRRVEHARPGDAGDFMRDTVWSIILTQTPIAVACLVVAWEMRGIRRALERIAALLGDLERRDDGKDG